MRRRSPQAELLAWLGPCIGRTAFEVGHDVFDAFSAQDAQAGEFFRATGSAGKWWADLAGLVAHAKANPGRLNYASGNTSSRVGAEMFKIATGIDMTYVSYSSNAQGILDVIAGTAQVMFSDASGPVLPSKKRWNTVCLPCMNDGQYKASASTRDTS